jgi:CRISPR/Cas system Type II protein with McrA/HNH and RuvC-like nuclease domain
VWQKGRVIPGKNPNQRRKDACGHEIDYSAYGDTNSRYGWEIDHIRPVARNGSDDISNLQPLYWETNRNKADTYPWECR